MKTTNDNDFNDFDTLDEKKGLLKGNKSKIILISVLVIVIFSILGYLFFKNKNIERNDIPNEEVEDAIGIHYLDLDELIVNLKANGDQNTFLRLDVTLVFKNSKDLEFAKKLKPSIRDAYFVYLRQLRAADLRGSIAIYRLRDALFRRTNKVLYPIVIDKLLFKEILVQ
ncbi:MAG: flagellar FliL protein [Candidatus Midichloriaceae bacterium]